MKTATVTTHNGKHGTWVTIQRETGETVRILVPDRGSLVASTSLATGGGLFGNPEHRS